MKFEVFNIKIKINPVQIEEILFKIQIVEKQNLFKKRKFVNLRENPVKKSRKSKNKNDIPDTKASSCKRAIFQTFASHKIECESILTGLLQRLYSKHNYNCTLRPQILPHGY